MRIPACCRLALIAVPLLLLAHASVSATEYRGGSAPSVKPWSARNYDDVKTLGVPKIIYFYDQDIFRNNFAEKMEGKDWLGNEDVQAAFKKFQRFKVRYDGLEARGWPKELRERSKNGASILLMSADNQTLLWFDRQTPPDNMSPERLIAGAKSIEEYDKTHKYVKEDAPKDKDAKDPKDNNKVAAKPDDLKIKGLPSAPGDDKPKDDKKVAPVATKRPSGPADE